MLLVAAPASSFLPHLAAPRTGSANPLLRRTAAAPLAPRFRAPVALAEDDDLNGYRELGLAEDATYDEIMDAFMSLSEQYAEDPGRLLKVELAKDKVLDERLRKRMSGELRPLVADPFEAKRVMRTPPWVIGKELATKLLGIPSKKHTQSVLVLMGGLGATPWFAPSVAGTVLMLNVISGLGFIYNRGLPEVPRDDFGQIGEIRPMKTKPFVVTAAVTAAAWLWGYAQTKRLIATAAVAPWIPELVLRTTLISAYLLVASLFVKPHDIFDYPLGVPLPKDRR